jgi:hypothetical protein
MQGYLLQTKTLFTFTKTPLLWQLSMLHEPWNVSAGPAWSLHFPSLTTCLVHSTWLQHLVFAPWATHTPLNCAWLVQPFLLQVLVCLAPCLEHTPPERTWLLHPSKQHRAFTFTASPFSPSQTSVTVKHTFFNFLSSSAIFSFLSSSAVWR